MNEDEKHEFKEDIVKQVSEIVSAQHAANKENWDRFNTDLSHRLEVVLPEVMRKVAPKDDRVFRVFLAILNGVVVGAVVFGAMWLFGA